MNTLTYEEALEIYNEMKKHIDRTDEDILYLYNNLIEKAIRYSHTRSEWTTLTRQERLDNDESRSILHDSFISSVNVIARTQGESGSAWRKRLILSPKTWSHRHLFSITERMGKPILFLCEKAENLYFVTTFCTQTNSKIFIMLLLVSFQF